MGGSTVLEIKTIGDEVLKQKAKKVAKKDIASRMDFINEMKEIMHKNGKAVGIAAPQVGISEQIIVIEIKDTPTYLNTKPLPLTIMINPRVTPLTKEKADGYEGCSSAIAIMGIVPRYKKILVEYIDEKGKNHKLELEDFQARVVQHEVDHLKGIMFFERVKDTKTFITRENHRKYVLKIEE
ncbi:MAG: peptide deformylase [Clostridiales bacterium GWD2_32_19]|nr:MAG: peptide deformylase [Clostridiales bacterium GWD2_32_19]